MRFALLLLCAGVCWAASAGDAAKAGLDPEQLKRIPVRMKALVDRGDAAGVVTLVARHGVIAELDAVGMQNIEERKPMRTDSIFQIMSMTKPVTAIAVMMLLEEGKLALTDPVELHLPEFRGQMLVAGRNPDGTVVLKKPSRPITIRDLMTHTSGLPGDAPPGFGELNQKMDHTLADAVLLFSQQPLHFEPGTKWEYSNAGIATLGRLIEVASDMPYEQFLQKRIFDPLGMKDSFFFPPADKIARIAMVYDGKDGKLVPANPYILGGDPARYRKGAKYPAPEWGLFSTAEDLLKFYLMTVDGTYAGRRYLSKPSLDLMREPHTAYLDHSGWLGGSAYGLAWEVVKDPLSTLMLMSPGTYGHGGAFGTQGWVDPGKDMIRILMVQKSNGGTDHLKAAFMDMAAAAIVE